MSDAWTTHPSPQDLAEFALGRLPVEQRSRISDHLAGCPGCRQRVVVEPTDAFAGDGQHGDAGGDAPVLTVDHQPSPSALADAYRTADHQRSPSALADANRLGVPWPTLPRYEILQEISRGGMGVVYKARDREVDRFVALKVLHNAGDMAAEARFQREVRILSMLHHPNIAMVYDYGVVQDAAPPSEVMDYFKGTDVDPEWLRRLGSSHYMAMEYVEGADLHRLVKQSGPLPVATACDYIRQAARGLQHAHDAQLVTLHRDIKPSNLMLASGGTIKVLDFGLARVTTRDMGHQHPSLHLPLFMGTYEYASPEQQAAVSNADTRSDIYSLGCTLFYLLTGQPPFRRDNVPDLIRAHLHEEPPPIQQFRSDVPAELATIVLRMLAKRPQDRLQSAAEVVAALKPFAPPETERGSRDLTPKMENGDRELTPKRAGCVAAAQGLVLLLLVVWLCRV